MSESDEVELHHLSGLAAAKNDDDSDDSADELIPTKGEMELTHAEVQKYLDEEKQARKERMMENEDPESDDETEEKTAGFSIDDRRNRYGKNKRGNMSAAQTEEMESLALQEALEKKQEQERLVCEMEFEDPELENDENGVDSAEETQETTKPSETDENSHPEVEKYLKIFQEIDEIELPKLEKIISENLTALKDAKTLVEFIDIKHSLLVDFKLAILFYLNLQLAGTKNVQFHPVTPRLKKYQEIYDSYKIRGSDFQTLNELLESVVDQENESSDEDEEEKDTSNIEKIKALENAKSKQSSSDILLESRKSKKAAKVKELEVTAEVEAEKSVKTVEEEDDDDKRGITKDMEKSKGHIVSKKKKIDRNPRVKNREKARVANWKHRKIHGVRKPKGRYDGEYSGINTSAVTSRKFWLKNLNVVKSRVKFPRFLISEYSKTCKFSSSNLI